MEGRSSPKPFERRGKFILVIFYEKFDTYVKKGFCKRAALSIEALLGYLEGVRLQVLLREKENAYLCYFFLDPKGIKS
jgi:hypothetical protein